jgi:dipeptide/tripeptide permease
MEKQLTNHAVVKEKFPRSFWVANSVELLERAAYYGMFITMTLYLSRVVGFSDVEAATLGGIFSALVYLFPLFTGTFADKIGFKNALLIAFGLLTIGYFTLAAFPSRVPVIIAYLVFILIGGSFIKSVITGTVSKSSNPANRQRAFSIFYSMVNIGAFSGKMLAKPIRTGIDLSFIGLDTYELGIQYIGYYSAAMTFIAFIIVFFIFKNVDSAGIGKSAKEIWAGFKKLASNSRLLWLIIIVSGFWFVQHQMYASMPKYIIRMVGEDASPEWIANVNPAMVMIFVYLVGSWMKKYKAITTITVGMFIMPFSVFFMSAGTALQATTGSTIDIIFGLTMHPITLMMILGIAFQGFAECFISPRYLEYFSLQSPKGEEGMYLGFAHLHSFVSTGLAFIASGFLLDWLCPDPTRADLIGLSPAELATHYTHAEYMWYIYAVVGLIAALALLVYAKYYNKKDKLEAESKAMLGTIN